MKLIKMWNNNSVYRDILQNFCKGKNKQFNLNGFQGSAKSFFISSLVNEQKKNIPFFCIMPDRESALHFYQDLVSFTGLQENKNIFIFPSFEILPYEDITRDNRIIEQRMKVLSFLALLKTNNSFKETDSKYPLIIVSNYRAILSKIMPVEDFNKQYKKLKIQDQLLPEEFLNYLLEQGYQNSYMIEYPGQFSQRGGIIDIFPFTEENPIRIELNGDRIESIRFFDLESQRSVSRVKEISLLPQKELQYLSNSKKQNEAGSFFDYLPSETNVIIQQYSELKNSIKEYEKEIQASYLTKLQNETKDILPPDYYYLNWKQVEDLTYQKRQLIIFDSLLERSKRNCCEEAAAENYKIETTLARNYYGQLDLFLKDLQQWREEKQNILIITGNKGRALRLAEIFADRDIYGYQLAPLREADLNHDSICLSYGQVNYGFSIPSVSLIVITDQEIFGRERDKDYHTRKTQGKSFHHIDELTIGDYVVHIQHGIGRYAGIYQRKRDGVNKDYILIKYAKDDELYVPVDQLNLVHKYIGVGGQPPKLYRLGGSSWKRVKKRVKASIQKTARELFELYKNRKAIRGFSFSGDSVWQQELEMAFPFEETPDQGKAMLDVKRDMESNEPMERLICGDVGYGKTEIAIRAAFKAVMDSKQVAVLAPTTILTQQHWENFSERMKPFPIKIEMLSRFKSKKEQQAIIADLKSGKIDIIIGTHRLVQNDIVFNDLGLLVVDEEQRFGVVHKERIKKLKEQVDSLTLTATPIPRTLYFSLIGVREMSLMNTPPELRLPIITYLKEKKEGIIREAIRREIERGGQVYFVHNRVENIDNVAYKLKKIVPEAQIIMAHGQMPEEELENIMIDFFNKKYNVLVCTTIIEIGLDIPNVNTIIIDDAHKFGLAQLYQLRGRVGRSERRAYAYLLYPSQNILTDNAKKRLQAIREFSDLGSGFRLAMRDLEIRGTGNLLGKKQHGFVSEIGFNFYCQLLEDNIDKLKQIDSGEIREQKKELEMDVKLDSYIPEHYIFDSENRVSYYQKLSQVETESELLDISKGLKDIYGQYPQEVKNLLDIVALKLKLEKEGVKQAKITPNYLYLKYEPNSSLEKGLSKINQNEFSVMHYKKGYHNVVKLYSGSSNKNLQSDMNILDESHRFLDNLLKQVN
jgi:transcription-repair coupling factor (superfamily II helicase)